MEELLGRLFRPADTVYRETRYCVELLAGALDTIIKRYNEKPNIDVLKKRVRELETAFLDAANSSQGLEAITQNTTRSKHKEIPPRHLLPRIFKLTIDERLKLFSPYYGDTLTYALLHEPEGLSEIEVDEVSKQHVIVARPAPDNCSPLIIAAELGNINAIRLFLSWGAPVDSRDSYGCTALHWAAAKGYLAIVDCLLDHGASLEARGFNGNTALIYAARWGKKDVVNRLLERKADVKVRDHQGKNALDLAIEKQPKLIDLILMHIATLSLDDQANCLLKIGGPYSNVLYYAAAQRPPLYSKLLAIILAQPEAMRASICKAKNTQGDDILLHAVQLGSHESITKLLALGLGITRDSKNQNALDIAIAKRPELILPILNDMTTLSEEQTERLFNACSKPEFFHNLTLSSAENAPSLTAALDKMHFDEHFEQIFSHYQLMRKKSYTNANYIAATTTTKNFLIECTKAKIRLFQNDGDIHEKMCLFKHACTRATERAKPVLEEHREFKRVAIF